MVPIGTRIRQRELVYEIRARLDRGLRYVRHAVHPVRESQAMPVHGRRLRQAIGDHDAGRLALAKAQLRGRHRAVVAPHLGLRVLRGDELLARDARGQ